MAGQAMVEIPPAAPPVPPQLVKVKAVSGGKAQGHLGSKSYGGAPITEAKATCPRSGAPKRPRWRVGQHAHGPRFEEKGKKYTCSVTVSNIF